MQNKFLGTFPFIIFFIFLKSFPLYSDYSHFYTVAGVTIYMIDGEVKKGYIPIYGNYYIDKENKDKYIEGSNLLELFSNDVSHVYYMKEYFCFDEVGCMTIEGEIDTIPLTEICKIIHNGKAYRGAAGSLASLPRNAIKKLQEKEIIDIRRYDPGGVADYVYVNLNPKLNKGIFYEAVINQILDDLVQACHPRYMEVIGDFTTRGGLHSEVKAVFDPDNRGRFA